MLITKNTEKSKRKIFDAARTSGILNLKGVGLGSKVPLLDLRSHVVTDTPSFLLVPPTQFLLSQNADLTEIDAVNLDGGTLVEVLEATSCSLSAVPLHLDVCENLTVLLLRHNQMRGSLTLPPKLQKLDVAHNRLEAISGEAPHLVSVDVSHNLLTELPQSIFLSAKELNASANRISALKVMTTPATILSFACNRIERFALSDAPSLVELHLGENVLQTLEMPDVACCLKTLVLSENPALTQLPSPNCMPNLERLDLRGCGFRTIDPMFAGTRLRSLLMQHNPVRGIPATTLANSQALLSLLKSRIAPLQTENQPPPASNLETTCVLTANSRSLTIAPSQRWRNLDAISVCAESLVEISVVRAELVGLIKVPGCLPHLLILNVAGNRISDLCMDIPKIEEMRLNDNLLTQIPECALCAQHLRELDLTNNSIAKFTGAPTSPVLSLMLISGNLDKRVMRYASLATQQLLSKLRNTQ